MCRLVLTALPLCWLLTLWLPAESLAAEQDVVADRSAEAAGIELFEQVIRPTLVTHCYECHSTESDEVQAGLRLDDRIAIRGGGDSGPAVVPGDPDSSPLLAAIEYESLQMPPDKKLSPEIIAAFRQWIDLGAPDPREEPAADAADRTSTQQPAELDWEKARSFWSFQLPRSVPLPRLEHGGWPRQRHDYFVFARLAGVGLTPSPRAPDRTLRRRLWLDLIGLPPDTPHEPQVSGRESHLDVSREVQMLLARPEFGERWARVWLDLARYAEDQAHIVGDDKSLFYPNAYLYRDWVIRAFNRDLPYDEFVRLQLAADLMQRQDDLVALGFLGLGPKYYDRGRLEVKAEEWEDRVDTVCRSLLGLTVACARCHDHKYDPIPTTDYYALAGVFASSVMFNQPLPDRDAEQKNNGEAKDPASAMHVVRDGEPTDLPVFVRGDVHSKGDLVHRGYLTVLSSDGRRQFTDGSGRRELADAITSRRNPLTARVFVNRIWGELMGQPLVATPSNFGTQGEPPTHPLLLDDLSMRFMDHHWSLKWLIREIVSSATYQQSSLVSPLHQQVDPQNQLLGRMTRKRLSVEGWRDSLLSASGQLDHSLGGPSIDPADPASRRRTVYAEVSRFQLNPMLATFDFPDANVHAAKRVATTTPVQKLFLLNNGFLLKQADAVVELVKWRSFDHPDAAVAELYRQVLARGPSPVEIDLAITFLEGYRDDPPQGWHQLAHALLASNELVFVD